MADIKITDLAGYSNPVSTDVLPIVDVGNDLTKKVSIADLLENAATGSASAPAFAFDGDNDTGIYRPGANQVAISTGGTDRMRIDSSGNVGIGTSNPQKQLHLVSGTGVGAVTAEIAFGSLSNQPQALIESLRTDGSYKGELLFSTSGSGSNSMGERMRITSSGNVGIGTSSPSSTLHVLGGYETAQIKRAGGVNDVNLDLVSGAGTEYKFTSTDSGQFLIKKNGVERLRIDSSGNTLLGGTASPASATKSLAIFNGTAPTGSVANGVVLYAQDVSSSSELKVRDEAGNVTTLSPHNFDLIPEGPSEDMAWSYYSEKDGKRINVDMLKAVRLLEQLTGEQLVFTG